LEPGATAAVEATVNAMYLDLMDILRAPGTSAERAIDLPPVALDDVRFTESIRGHVKAANARRNIVITGRAASSVEMRCSRCLRAFSQPLEMELEAVAPVSFFRAAPNTVIPKAGAKTAGRTGDEGDGEEDEDVDDETAAIFDAHTVDVLELLRQAAVLNWPIQPLCADDCAGLPEATRYEVEPDNRWAALKALAGDAPAGDAMDADGTQANGVDVDEEAPEWSEDISDEELLGEHSRGEESFEEESRN
jgi:uncharacterized protein